VKSASLDEDHLITNRMESEDLSSSKLLNKSSALPGGDANLNDSRPTETNKKESTTSIVSNALSNPKEKDSRGKSRTEKGRKNEDERLTKDDSDIPYQLVKTKKRKGNKKGLQQDRECFFTSASSD